MQSKISDLSNKDARAMETERLMINGQRILFDKKVKLLPVETEKKKINI